MEAKSLCLYFCVLFCVCLWENWDEGVCMCGWMQGSFSNSVWLWPFRLVGFEMATIEGCVFVVCFFLSPHTVPMVWLPPSAPPSGRFACWTTFRELIREAPSQQNNVILRCRFDAIPRPQWVQIRMADHADSIHHWSIGMRVLATLFFSPPSPLPPHTNTNTQNSLALSSTATPTFPSRPSIYPSRQIRRNTMAIFISVPEPNQKLLQ